MRKLLAIDQDLEENITFIMQKYMFKNGYEVYNHFNRKYKLSYYHNDLLRSNDINTIEDFHNETNINVCSECKTIVDDSYYYRRGNFKGIVDDPQYIVVCWNCKQKQTEFEWSYMQ